MEGIEDPEILVRYLSSEKKYANDKERIKNAIIRIWAYLQSHPEDKVVRQAYLSFITEKGFFNLEDIKVALEDAEKWMKQFGPIPLFDNYITVILKIKKTGINIKIDTDLVTQLGYSYINSAEGNPRVIRDFAKYLATEKRFDEAQKIYENLLKIKTNPETKSSIYFTYGQMLLGQAMTMEPSSIERMEKLKKAEEKFRKAFKINNLHYMALVFLSITLKEEGKEEDAKKKLEKAEKIARKFKKARQEKFSAGEIPYKIGVFYLEFDRYEDAIYWLEMACNEEPENFANWWRLGYAKKKYALLLKEQSREEYKRFLSEALSDLEISWKKAPKLLQLPASEDIPNLIAECKKQLQSNIEEN
ncbi:hypothetical protein [Candidatus Methanodesulfokora washburnensis]|jgi:tetratricopeptide (TPR) repeat protein|uniref:Tetratricopeptide repeat protein n=1 Tax=Candidatus Methanodesulfokora washburnensis TaxID=2478471 RepID=A0A429GRD6_9CREN|nr:hypothetical protein [Candidatus Methanodesulfokores washburnensis]RSN76259.1 hypothetical protein D6D85_04725 [Candidatus Methanodesulfokores washburnensis]